VSKRPRTANAVMSRLRRPVGRLRDLPIWSKLGLIMLVPTLATIVVGTNGLVDHIDEASNAERARTLALLSDVSGDLVDHLQNERAGAVWVLAARDNGSRDQAMKLYNAEHPLVENARRPYEQQKAALNELPAKLTVLLVRLDRNLEGLPSLRSQVANRSLKLSEAAENYQLILSDLLALRDSSAQLAGDIVLSDHMRTAASVARAKEFTAQQRVVGHEVIGQNSLTPQLRKDFIFTETGQEQAEQAMKATATEAERQLYEEAISGPDLLAATNYIGYIDTKNETDISDIPFSPQDWDGAMVGYNRLMRSVESTLDKEIGNEATALRDNVQRRVFVETGALLGMLLLAILFAWLVARSMARSLRELRQGALSIAQFGLPHAVGRLRDPSLSSSLTPAQLADQIAEPLPVRSRDEFGQVTEAFNAVHLEAVRTAAEQAALRSSVSTMFVNLARRSQILVDRLIGHLDRLERGEEDPDRLAELFQLDHLATRMRRNDENLLVLAGADSTRIQREPAALIDVLRAAQSEVEHYTRIEFGRVDRDIEVSAHAVNDMVHLVAELFDNATAFSPPDSHVMVEARRVGDRTTLYVEDRGIGISPDQIRELNERLANPPMVDVAVSRMMGLVVVARLANRHGVKVELRPAAAERGTVADVTLPSAVLVPRALAGRLQPGGATSFDSGPAEQAPRPSFGAPLALESGPTGGGRGSGQAPAYSTSGGFPAGRPFDPNPPAVSGGMLGGRSVPAWSDLTGAPGSNGSGSNGNNGFHGPRSNEMLPPIPSRPDAADDSLPRRSNGSPYSEETGSFSAGASIPRQLPSNPEHQGRNPFVPPVSAPPMPPVSGSPYGRPVSAPPVPGRPVSAPPVSAPPASSGMSAPTAPHPSLVSPSGSYPVVPASAPPAAAAPPVWPPVAEKDTGSTPVVPQSLAAALDMTAEFPPVRDRFASGQQQAAYSERQRTSERQQVFDRQQSDIQRAAAQQRAEDQRAADGRATAEQFEAARPGDDAAPGGPRSDAQRAAEHAAAAHQAATAQAAAAQATAAAQIAAAQAAARQRASGDNQARFADETMELPIFRELESAWFQTAPAEDAPAALVAQPAAQNLAPRGGDPAATMVQRFSTAEPTRPPSVPHQGGSPDRAPNHQSEIVPANGDIPAPRTTANATVRAMGNTASAGNGGSAAGNAWRTAADDGWQAARAAAETPVDTTTTAGLPKRTPMAQLVPGGVERAGASVQRRTPEAVRGLLSAYHRGVQRGRTKDHPTNPEETPGGQQSSQAGKEHEG
jgi:anti-sigma regulatory factor (Ser/Thr protein kinase)